MRITKILTTPCSELRLLPDEEVHEIAQKVAEYYQKKGFPYYDLTDRAIKIDFDKLLKYDILKLELDDDGLQQNMLGLNIANYFHPQMWEVKVNNQPSPMELFLDLDKFTTAIYKRIKYSDTKLQPYNIRKSLKVFGAQSVSNFRPTIAKYIYEMYGKGGSVLDPCAGYGGRVLGALASNIQEYYGCDPDWEQITGNKYLVEKITSLYDNVKFPECDFSTAPFEDVGFVKESFDLIFTSPPYFDKEKYSNNPNQSYMRYPTYSQWRDGFLHTLILNSHTALKYGGYFALNVAGYQIIEDTLEMANPLFGEPVVTKYMRLSKILGKGDKDKISHKLEPIYIWQK